jgi:hypothetical protein
MPNGCYCSLWIKGSEAELLRFRDGVVTEGEWEEGSLLKSYLPVPDAFAGIHEGLAKLPNGRWVTLWQDPDDTGTGSIDTGVAEIPDVTLSYLESTYGAVCASDWCLQHWGATGCDRETILVEDSPQRGQLHYRFQMAWEPPLAGILALSLRFSGLTFEIAYHEPQGGFSGMMQCRKGQILTATRKELEDELPVSPT